MVLVSGCNETLEEKSVCRKKLIARSRHGSSILGGESLSEGRFSLENPAASMITKSTVGPARLSMRTSKAVGLTERVKVAHRNLCTFLELEHLQSTVTSRCWASSQGVIMHRGKKRNKLI